MKRFSLFIVTVLMLFTASAFVVGCDSDYTPVVQPGAKEQGENVVSTREQVTKKPATETKATLIRNNSTKYIQIKFNYDPPIIRRLAPGQEINADPLGKGTNPTRLVCEEPYYAQTDSNECVIYR